MLGNNIEVDVKAKCIGGEKSPRQNWLNKWKPLRPM